jgi:hypothetical protein
MKLSAAKEKKIRATMERLFKHVLTDELLKKAIDDAIEAIKKHEPQTPKTD